VGDRSRGRFATPADLPRHAVPRTGDDTKNAGFGVVQGPFFVAPCQTLAIRFATFASLCACALAGVGPAEILCSRLGACKGGVRKQRW
jgi:hypothetical protein